MRPSEQKFGSFTVGSADLSYLDPQCNAMQWDQKNKIYGKVGTEESNIVGQILWVKYCGSLGPARGWSESVSGIVLSA